MHARAFTLVEALIAVSLGMVVVLTTFAGVRAASQTVSKANRLSVENAMLRAGIDAAHDEVDFWQGYDDPDKAFTARPLTKADASGAGRAFAPFAAGPAGPGVWPKVGGGTPEDERGFVADAVEWAPFQSRTWYHGSLTEMNYCPMTFGRYSIFFNTSASPSYASAQPYYHYEPDEVAGTIYPGSGPTKGYDPWVTTYSGAPAPLHRWYCNQLKDLLNAVGFYGFSEYLPANAIYTIVDPTDANGRNSDDLPYFWILPRPGGFCNGEIAGRLPACRFRDTAMASFCLVDPATADAGWPAEPALPSGAAAPPVNLDADPRTTYQVGFGGNQDIMAQFLWRVEAERPLFAGDLRPSHWPRATVSVGRFLKNARPITLCYVRTADPDTGNHLALSFTSWGTTLRGARQQRASSGGWAAWDDKIPATSNANDKTLDDY